jgi:hypothetical protein
MNPVTSKASIARQLPTSLQVARWLTQLYTHVYGRAPEGDTWVNHDYSSVWDKVLNYVIKTNILGPQAVLLTSEIARKLLRRPGKVSVFVWAMHIGEESDIPDKSSITRFPAHYLTKITLVRPLTRADLVAIDRNAAVSVEYRTGAIYWYNPNIHKMDRVSDNIPPIGEDINRAHATFTWIIRD